MSELKNKWRPRVHINYIECVPVEHKKSIFDIFRKKKPIEIIDNEYKLNVIIDRKNFVRLTEFMGEYNDFKLIPVEKEPFQGADFFEDEV